MTVVLAQMSVTASQQESQRIGCVYQRMHTSITSVGNCISLVLSLSRRSLFKASSLLGKSMASINATEPPSRTLRPSPDARVRMMPPSLAASGSPHCPSSSLSSLQIFMPLYDRLTVFFARLLKPAIRLHCIEMNANNRLVAIVVQRRARLITYQFHLQTYAFLSRLIGLKIIATNNPVG